MSHSSILVTLYKPKNEVEFSIISSLLQEAKIPFMVRNSEVQDLFGMGRIGTGYNFVTGPMVILVNENQLLSAREVISEFIDNSENNIISKSESDSESYFRFCINMSIVLGIIFPGLGIYHLIKAIFLKRRNKNLIKAKFKLSISMLIFLIGCSIYFVMILGS